MAQRVKNMPLKHKNLNLDSQKARKTVGCGNVHYNPNAGVGGGGGGGDQRMLWLTGAYLKK